MLWILIPIGWVVGVLINLCADSLPVSRRLSLPTCPNCHAPRPKAAWSGLLAFLTRRRRCSECTTPLPIRHPLVELATPAVFCFCGLRTGATIPTLFNAVYSAILILITVTDLEHRLIMHVVSLPAICLAILGAFVNPVFDRPARALLGGGIGLLGSLMLYGLGLLFSWWLSKSRGEPLPGPAFGFGDVTLSTFLGLIVGAPDIIFAFVIGISAGFVGAMAYLLIKGLVQRQHRMFTAFLPYGPFLIIGGAFMLFFGREFMAWYIG